MVFSLLLRFSLLLVCFGLPAWLDAGPGEWKQIGPFGGDVRTLADDPGDFSRLFLGTSNGSIYASADGGRSWTWWSQVAPRHDYVVDEIIIDARDPSVMYAGVWSTEAGAGGGVFKSDDGGRTWRVLPGIAGQSVRSLAQARSNEKILVAGTLQGVFRTTDAGESWERISPAYHEEIRNIESLAIDPTQPDVIYAGTWHLPWKTTDGGRTWNSVKSGIIDDSDIFSMVIDWSNPNTIFASACSGIYRTDSGGAAWRKIQGIPHTARRTRVLRQDPKNAAIVYAGTTEGLWKTESGGASWRRITSARLIINDIVIDPRDPRRLLLGTDRAGVLESLDGGENFQARNYGFAHRQVSRAAFDPRAGRLYVAVLHDKEYGGIFASSAGREWEQLGAGLEDRDVFALIYAAGPGGGRLLAGLKDGMMAWDPQRKVWEPTGRVLRSAPPEPAPKVAVARRPAGRSPRSPTPAPKTVPAGPSSPAPGLLRAAVDDFFQAGPDQPVYAATSSGVMKSVDAGATWTPASPPFFITTVAAAGNFMVAGTPTGLDLSLNGGRHWFHIYLPAGTARAHVNAIALAGKTIFVATDAGLFRSLDGGARWERRGRGVPYAPVSGVRVHPADPRQVFVIARQTGIVYRSDDGGNTFANLSRDGIAGGPLRGLEIMPALGGAGFQLLVASGFDGLFMQPLAPRAAPQLATAGDAAGKQ